MYTHVINRQLIFYVRRKRDTIYDFRSFRALYPRIRVILCERRCVHLRDGSFPVYGFSFHIAACHMSVSTGLWYPDIHPSG